jgi:hypothetical protein
MKADAGKWCTHCRKASHNDSECWCTRVIPGSSDPLAAQVGWLGGVSLPPLSKALQAALNKAVQARAKEQPTLQPGNFASAEDA